MPQPRIDPLAPGVRRVIPVGRGVQDLRLIERVGDGVAARTVLPVQFVPRPGIVQKTRSTIERFARSGEPWRIRKVGL